MTSPRKSVLTATATAIGIAFAMTGCGNQIMQNYSWPVTAAAATSVPYDNNDGSITTWTAALAGLRGTSYWERCDAPPRKGRTQPPISCIVIVNTGRQVYVGYSANTVGLPDGTFKSLAPAGSPDTIVVKTDPQSPPPPINLHVSIHNNG
jgi:hypothetical protein